MTNEIAMMDGDEEATDPLVDAQELLSRMKWLSCRIPPLRRRHRKAVKMVKSMGEGDWGGQDDLEKPDVRSHGHRTPDWLLDFVRAGPPIVSSGSDNDNATRWEQMDQGPQPGTQHEAHVRTRLTSWPTYGQGGGAVPDPHRARYKQGER